MKRLGKSEIKTILPTVKAILSMDGDYALVDSNMQVKSMCIYTVKNGKLYDDISFGITGEAYSDEDFEDLKDYSDELQFALLAKQFNFSYPD